ncbi:ATP-dependent DNA helicase recQ [Acholeplasma oculi]|uniref:DNA 3'-5' helicase n=1 Tax=Acholeplasma oculi TaxID=35623 RepID=A0A061AFG4_9MOLU|nr:RecQ family ATP-dependent DNA helicase [Acholeplasma oculi]CDR30266.1 ATP-dependent DNA helicase, RecQ-family [Acholeplasma oculi]SKC43428.1 ATP-dependent DNA helicase RecQ [Acholeplasma oculi]SUT88687.1 ATP-dependent DNA helicase recQ [Acholeplasma oculi]
MTFYIDTEVSQNFKIKDIGCLNDKGEYIHTANPDELYQFIKKADFFVGHNIVQHDLVYLRRLKYGKIFHEDMSIDTLFLSTLLFPEKPYHKLVKDDKLETDTLNNPLNDAMNSKKLFLEIIEAFNNLDEDMKDIFFNLLSDKEGFKGFFKYIKFKRKIRNLYDLIMYKFEGLICKNSNLHQYIKKHPIELSYALTLIKTNNVESLLPAWVLKNYAYVEVILTELRGTLCYQGCSYCEQKINPVIALNKIYGYEKFRTFDGDNLQENAVRSALKGESLIAVFPTGGGKSLTFQLPALISREATRGLTVVISPLQSLMKDQVDNLEEKSVTAAVTINGLLDPIQRANAIKRVSDGSAGILYIAPESLRSKTIESLLINRHVVRIVIDEAHCFSTWGHDFRVDYLYIGDFIKKIQEIKKQEYPIPVSCFTATAKQNVIEDIAEYFRKKLNLEMKIFKTDSSRKNLKYKVMDVKEEALRYPLMRSIVEQEDRPTIIYASRRKTVETLYHKMTSDNFNVSYFHGGMEIDQKVKEQDKFMTGQTKIMIATSAFGMGVDKSDVGCVIHYEISDSLENYVQESGRAGRNENINANCYVLYNEDDLNKHFDMLNSSKLNIKEIQSIWKAIKDLTKLRDNVSQSALEIAKMAGWDDSIMDLQTRVTTAIAALEDAGYLKRGQNSPRLYANSIIVNSVIEANQLIEQSGLFINQDLIHAKRIMQMLISSKYRSKAGNAESESRVDYISDILGIDKKDVIKTIGLLREAKILSDDKDLNSHIKSNTKPTQAVKTLEDNVKLMRFILNHVSHDAKIYNIKNLNELAHDAELNCTTKSLRAALNYLEISKLIMVSKEGKDSLKILLEGDRETIIEHIDRLYQISSVIVSYLFNKSFTPKTDQSENLVSFSILELKYHYEKIQGFLDQSIEQKDIEQAIFFLQKIHALHIEGGFMVIYSPINVERVIKDNYKQFTKTDYKKLEDFYKGKMHQIHIVGEYASKMLKDYESALTFVNDYFKFDFEYFLNKYFSGSRRKELDRNLSPKKFKELFGTLTTEQLSVITEKHHKRIAVAAGPGSGKTKLLVHKLASIIHMEDVRQEQLLMLTFSRAAVVEFKSRLLDLIGPPAYYIDITTFHSFAFDLLGKVGDLEKTDTIIKDATQLIINNEVDAYKVTRAVLVIDEAQDMNEDEFNLIQALINYNENLTVIAVGDDDQNIFEFRGSSSEYFRQIAKEENAFYELTVNFRSKNNLVEFANQFAMKIPNRLKSTPIRSFTDKDGTIKITRQLNRNYVSSIVNEVIHSSYQGTTCILTKTNEQALEITGLLKKHKVQASLIQNNEDFKLFHLYELNHFYQTLVKMDSVNITDVNWESAMNKFKNQFTHSKNYDLLIRILESFKKTSSKIIYISDFKEFLYEASLSDYYLESKVMVSTYHKAKGKEFDHVILLYDNEYRNIQDGELKALYVGITRAKTSLSIHTNHAVFDQISTNNIHRVIDESPHIRSDRLVVQSGHKGINLGYSKFVQKNIANALPGNKLELIDENILTFNGRKVLKFSNATQNQISDLLEKGYKLTDGSIDHMVYWFDRTDESYNLIVLPELIFDDVGTLENDVYKKVENS